MEVDGECLTFRNMEVLRINVCREALRNRWESMAVTYGLKHCQVWILPTVSQDVLNWDARHTLGWVWEQQEDKKKSNSEEGGNVVEENMDLEAGDVHNLGGGES